MRYVLDSNIALKWVLPEADSDRAIRLRDGLLRGTDQLLSPDVFPVEIAHSLAKAERSGDMKHGEGAKKLVDVFAFMPDLHSYLPLLPRAFAIASQARVGVYDCLYITLAEREGCELLTADGRLVRALQPAFRFITHLSTLP